MAREDEEIDRYHAAKLAEQSLLEGRYGRLASPHADRRWRAQELVLECARRAEFVGKAKSRRVGFGRYGRRTKAETAKIIDDSAFMNWLRVKDPTLIKTVTTERVAFQDAKPLILNHVHDTGEVPPGVEHFDERDEPFADPSTPNNEETQ